MTTLCIETSTSCCSVVICQDGLALANRENLLAANHASELPLFVEQLLAEARANQWCIDAVALSQGPGSYTGLRIGTSIAKGICYGMNIPLIPIDTLRILSAAAQDFPMIERNSWLCPMIDARRMEVYTAFYNANTLERLNEIESKIIDNTAFEEHLGNHEIYFFGNGAAKCKDIILSPHAHFIDDIVPRAIYMGMLLENAPSLDAKQMAYYEPFYLKDFVPAPSHIKGLK